MNDHSPYSNVKVLPVLFGFFVMGFVDVVGISTSYVQKDFGLSETLSNMLPMTVFLWFALLSVPTGLLMNRIGRKRTVLVSMVITFIAMVIPAFIYTFWTALLAFALLGIGNTILQVSLNPLVSNVVQPEKLTSRLTLGQFIKAISAFLGPVIASFSVTAFGDWKMIFPVFGGIVLLSSFWLLLTPIKESEKIKIDTSFSRTFELLKDRVVLILFFGILFVVGVDVGMNMGTPKFLMERTGLPLEQAGLGTSLYFAARTAGTLIGAILLARLSISYFFKVSMGLAVLSMIVLIFSTGTIWVLLLVALIGLAIANVFSIIFSIALQRVPERGNEVSGLMIMGVAGGALLPVLMGIMSDLLGQTGGMIVILLAMLYLFVIAFHLVLRK
jgi:fucose permease